MGTDLTRARVTLETITGRTAGLLSSIPSGELTMRESQRWTIGDVGVHLVLTLRGFTQAADGVSEREPVLERHPAALAILMLDAMHAFLAATAHSPADELVSVGWYGQRAPPLSLRDAIGLLIGEQIIHGHDIARTVARPWTISEAEAVLTLPVGCGTAREHTASYEVHTRGGRRFLVRFRTGCPRWNRSAARPCDDQGLTASTPGGRPQRPAGPGC
ncbi:MAG TPA: DinB family protein [Pseudonocardiaceae bacterium]|nr:DinB family protein [Pseudonocardiaceae bacterium]